MARVRYLTPEDPVPEYQEGRRMNSNITRALTNNPWGARHVAGNLNRPAPPPGGAPRRHRPGRRQAMPRL